MLLLEAMLVLSLMHEGPVFFDDSLSVDEDDPPSYYDEPSDSVTEVPEIFRKDPNGEFERWKLEAKAPVLTY